MVRAALLLVLVASCGRLGFDDDTQPAGDGGNLADAAADGASVDADVTKLTNRGLLGRYFLTESATAAALSPTAGGLVLDVVDVDNELSATQLATGSGLTFSTVGGDARACIDVAATTLQSELDGGTTGTIEVVADIQQGTAMRSRLAGIGVDVEWSFALGFSSVDSMLIFSMNVTAIEFGRWNIDAGLLGRTVYTLVYDSEAPIVSERVRLYIDGQQSVPNTGVAIMPGQSLTLGASTYCIGNRRSGMRAPQGTIFYAAIYASALGEKEVFVNAQRLLQNDD
jgi:hypothetical protein